MKVEGHIDLNETAGWRELEGVTVVSMHSDPHNQELPAWLTVSFRGGSYEVVVDKEKEA